MKIYFIIFKWYPTFESLIKSLNVSDKIFGTTNIIFPSIYSVLTRYIRSENIKILNCNENLKLDLDKNIEQIKRLDYLLLTFAYGYPYNFELVNKIFFINDKIILIYDLSHCQGIQIKVLIIKTKYIIFLALKQKLSTGEGGIVSTDDYFIYENDT